MNKMLKEEESLSYQLNKRVRELSCLHKVSQLTEKTNNSIGQVIEGIMLTLPYAWKYPDKTFIRCNFGDKSFTSINFQETKWKYEVSFDGKKDKLGTLEVFYLELRPNLNETAFYKEEQVLLQTISKLIVAYHERKLNEDKILQTNSDLRSEIEERKQTEKQLAKSELKFKSVVDNIPGFFYTCDLSEPWEFFFMTDEIETFSGYPKEDYLGVNSKRNFGEIIHPEDREQVLEQVQIAIDNNKPYQIEYRILHKDGFVHYVNDYGQAMYNNDGSPDYLVGGIFNETEKKKVQIQLERSELQFKKLLQNLPGVMYKCGVDHPWEMFFITDYIERLSGYPKEDFLGINSKRTFGDIIHPDDREQASKAVQLAINSNKSYKIEYRVIDKDGTIHHVYGYGQAMYNPDGSPDYLVGGIFDDSERLAAVQKLKESEERFQLAVKGTNAGIWDLNVKSGKAYWSDIHYQLLGYEVNEIQPTLTFLRDSVVEQDLPIFDKIVKSHITSGSLFDFEARFYTKNREIRWFRSRGASSRDENGNAIRIVGAFSDTTDKKEAENALAAKEQQLQYALDVSNEGIWEWNIDKDNILYSSRCYTMIGYLTPEDDESTIDFWNKATHKDDISKSLISNIDNIASSGLFDNIYRVISKFKEVRWIHTKGKAVEFSINGKPSRVIGTMSDITDRMKQEEQIVSAVLETEDKERSRIARDIHDGLQQTMSTALMSFEKVRSSTDFKDEKTYERFHLGYKYLKKSIEESRTLAHNLMPKVVDRNGIVAAIESLLSAIENSTETQFGFDQNLNDERLKLSEEMTFYRIVQEAVNNVMKYANAKNCNIQLLKHSDIVILTIEDDGVGFEMENTGNSFGINSMKTRADSIGAFFEINSRINRGTQILLELTLN